jgi:5-hydroxyisourate hydrolase-like protein (transthyretin family)
VAVPAEYAEGIRGVVWNADADAPAAGAVVRLYSAGQVLAETRTDQNGVFSFESAGDLTVAAGTYRIIIEFAGRRVELSIVAEASQPVTLVGRVEI